MWERSSSVLDLSKDQVPSDKNLSYLELRNGETKLKKNSDYYFQIQGQMGVAEGNYTDFFVFTFRGYHKERILFDKEFWCEVLQKLVWFWKKFIGPELVTCNLKHQLEEDDLGQALQELQQPSSSKHATTSESSETTCNSMVILTSEQVVADGYQKTCIKKKKEKTKPEKKKSQSRPVFAYVEHVRKRWLMVQQNLRKKVLGVINVHFGITSYVLE